jgi:hypothetical protein
MNEVEPHGFRRLGWRWWLCVHCYLPKSAHPTTTFTAARPYDDMRRSAEDLASR